jgi:hypothetical protein
VFRWSILLAFVACILVTPAAAQAPAPTTTVFDGAYLGVSRTFEEATVPAHEGRTWTHFCSSYGLPAPLTIVNGVARTQWVGTAEGSVSPQGVLVMRGPRGHRFDGQIDGHGTVTGRMTGPCSYQFVWQKPPAPTMPFDGDYIGVSRESSGWGIECPQSGVPAAVIIRNSVALGSWQGTVSPQGALAIRNQRFSRVDAQIDPQGTVRGQNSGPGCTTMFVWRKQPG